MDIFELFKKIEKNDTKKQPVTHMIVGLGNPGQKYQNTRHNAGFIALEYVAKQLGISINTSKFDALVCQATIADKSTLFVLPQTYMNNSGIAVSKAAKFYKIEPQNIVVVCDDVSFDVGKRRIRKKGSAGGQNGLKSIIEHLGTDEFVRIKLGVGKKPHPEMDLADWVLSCFTQDERKTLEEKLCDVYSAIKLVVDGQTDKAMNDYNS